MAITLDVGTATVVTQLLGLLADQPSPPAMVAKEARQHMGSLEELLPPPSRHQHAGERMRLGTVTIETVPATGVAGLLELLGELPSTPPAVAEDARHHAEALWEALTATASDDVVDWDPQQGPSGGSQGHG
ncbi:MAG TPA: hypothetical protein VG452_12415 [Egibacteraceae bacterium]|nr:hypothetical protein [Egibacteraceae bacterium]